MTGQSTLASQTAVVCVAQISGWLVRTRKGAESTSCEPSTLLTCSRYGLAWSPTKAGHVLGAGEDTTVCHWYANGISCACPTATDVPFQRDINSYTKVKSTIEPTTVFRGHNSVVGVSGFVLVYGQTHHGILTRMLIGIRPRRMCLPA